MMIRLGDPKGWGGKEDFLQFELGKSLDSLPSLGSRSKRNWRIALCWSGWQTSGFA